MTMKKLFVFTMFLLFVVNLFGQSHGLNYQAVILNPNRTTGIGNQKNYWPNKELIVRFTISNSAAGIDYQEEHVTKTDALGMINLVIGKGTPTALNPLYTRVTVYDNGPSTTTTSRTFKEISWDGTSKMLKVEICTEKYLRQFTAIDQQSLYFAPHAYHRNITAIGTMDIEGVSNLNSALNVRRTSPTNLSGVLNVTKHTTLNDTLTVNAISVLNGQTSINVSLDGDASDPAAYPLNIEGSNHGIAITINGSRTSDNSFVTFMDASGVQGAITGQTNSDVYNDPEFIYTTVLYAAKVIVQAVNLGVATAALFIEPGNFANEVANTAFLAAEIVGYYVFAFQGIGVDYSSGSGDYAEWLPRMDAYEDIRFGDIVGVYGGMVTKKTDNAEQIMVVSKSPIVLGNIPANDSITALGEKVGFMGQVPVWVIGKVKQGDFIVAYKSGSGLGIAVAPENLTIEMMPKIVGKAWDNNNSDGRKLVNTVIGLKNNEWVNLIKENQQRTKQLEEQVNKLNEELNLSNETLFELVTGYKTAIEGKNSDQQMNSSVKNQTDVKEQPRKKFKWFGNN